MKKTDAAKAELAKQLGLFAGSDTQGDDSKPDFGHGICDNVKRSTVIQNENVCLEGDSLNGNGQQGPLHLRVKLRAERIAFAIDHPENTFRWQMLWVALMVEGVALSIQGRKVTLEREDMEAAIQNANKARPKAGKTLGDAACCGFLGELKRRIAKLIDWQDKPEAIELPTWDEVRATANCIGYVWVRSNMFCSPQAHPPDVLAKRRRRRGDG